MITRKLMRQNIIRFLTTTKNTVDQQEIQQFQKFVAGWWDEFGPVKPLHAMNKLRVPFVRDGLVNAGAIESHRVNGPSPLTGLSILDIGCGGGILSGPLARLGADVTGIDANADLIDVARSHAHFEGLKLDFVSTSVEEHARQNAERYDAIVASEVLEHVSEKNAFLEACLDCLKPGGSIFLTTISQTRFAEFFAVFMAEDVSKLVPHGTHQYEKFIRPHKLQRLLEDLNCRTVLMHGMFYNVVTNKWHWCSNTSINYVLHAIKQKNIEDYA